MEDTGNHHANALISILITRSSMFRAICINPIINISFVACQFIGNVVNELININALSCKSNLLIIGPTHVTNTKFGLYQHSNIIAISNMAVDVKGPIITLDKLSCFLTNVI